MLMLQSPMGACSPLQVARLAQLAVQAAAVAGEWLHEKKRAIGRPHILSLSLRLLQLDSGAGISCACGREALLIPLHLQSRERVFGALDMLILAVPQIQLMRLP